MQRSIVAIAFFGLCMTVAAPAASAQRPRRTAGSEAYRAHQIGFDEGYREGYHRGSEDSVKGKRHGVDEFEAYRDGDRGYSDSIGSRDQYRIGYRSGFEKGYEDGFNGRQYGATPGDSPVASGSGGGPVLSRGKASKRGSLPAHSSAPPAVTSTTTAHAGVLRTPYDSSLVIELETPITTRHSKAGDRFWARVVDPQPYYGARVEGYLARVERPGRISGKAEIVMAFQAITFPDGYSEPLSGQVEEVIGYEKGSPRPSRGPLAKVPWPKKSDDRNDDIDAEASDEGTLEGTGNRGRDVAIIGGSTVAGAVLGSVLGGGAGLGAIIGAAAGGGIVAMNRGHEIDLEPGARLRIRTGTPAVP
jgi:hypothetical protein